MTIGKMGPSRPKLRFKTISSQASCMKLRLIRVVSQMACLGSSAMSPKRPHLLGNNTVPLDI